MQRQRQAEAEALAATCGLQVSSVCVSFGRRQHRVYPELHSLQQRNDLRGASASSLGVLVCTGGEKRFDHLDMALERRNEENVACQGAMVSWTMVHSHTRGQERCDDRGMTGLR